MVALEEALAAASRAGLDLVEVAPGETPVCKVLDYGKLRFENQKKKAANRKNQRTTTPVSYTHLRAHETVLDLVCRLLLEKKK